MPSSVKNPPQGDGGGPREGRGGPARRHRGQVQGHQDDQAGGHCRHEDCRRPSERSATHPSSPIQNPITMQS